METGHFLRYEQPFLHLHLYGRTTDSHQQHWGEALYFSDPGTDFYDHNAPLGQDDISEILSQLKKLEYFSQYAPGHEIQTKDREAAARGDCESISHTNIVNEVMDRESNDDAYIVEGEDIMFHLAFRYFESDGTNKDILRNNARNRQQITNFIGPQFRRPNA